MAWNIKKLSAGVGAMTLLDRRLVGGKMSAAAPCGLPLGWPTPRPTYPAKTCIIGIGGAGGMPVARGWTIIIIP